MNYRKILLLSLGHLSCDLNSHALPALLPYLAAAHNFDYQTCGFLAFAYSAVASLVQPGLGLLADKMARGWFIPLGILLDAHSTRRMTDRAGAVGSLYELYRRLLRNPGAAFGLLTFALYLGFLPVYTGMAEGLRHPLYYSVFALISLFLLAYALRKTAGKEEEEGGL